MLIAEVSHLGLKKYRVIRDRDHDILRRKVEAQRGKWDGMWQRQLKREARAQRGWGWRAEVARDALAQLEGILRHALTVNDPVDWDSLEDNSPYGEPEPSPPDRPEQPPKPLASDERYRPALTFADKLLQSRRERKISEALALYERDQEAWRDECARLERQAQEAQQDYERRHATWEDARAEFLRKQEILNEQVEARHRQYLNGDCQAVVDNCELVLSGSQYPDYFPQEFDLDYNPETKILIVEMVLPNLQDLPKTKDFKYIKSTGESKEVQLSDSALRSLYDNVIYQVALRTIHELFEADIADALEAIIFNGWVRSVDPATGQPVRPCIISMQAGKAEFSEINLENVDPKSCFRKLKGIGSSKLHSMVAIAPILNISREDDRFVAPQSVTGSLDAGVNIASMPWEEFEHLIREIFESEFSSGGGEVKITRASRDRGVDAVAFDPDPIRGGKIVIQAKRYTQTVGVSAVRDLYGTVLNEGANKGILVTTADYGPDAYEFARDKPLTLMNGSNLLHLLQKHGHRAKIDLKEARDQASGP